MASKQHSSLHAFPFVSSLRNETSSSKNINHGKNRSLRDKKKKKHRKAKTDSNLTSKALGIQELAGNSNRAL